jgi:hypothetical protein
VKRIANRSGCGNVSMVTALLERIWEEDGNDQEDGMVDCLGLGWSEVGVAHPLMSQFGLKQHFKSS